MCRQHVKPKMVLDACMRYRKSVLADSEIQKVNVYSHLCKIQMRIFCIPCLVTGIVPS